MNEDELFQDDPVSPPVVPAPCLEDFRIAGDHAAELFTALAAAQLEYEEVKKDETAQVEPKTGRPYSYKYSTLQGTISATRAALNKHGLAFIQPFTVREGICVIRTIVAHDTGTYLEAICSFDATQEEGYMSRWQLLGSAVTYCRRYACQAILGVAPAEDDDGASAPNPVRTRQEPPKPPTQPKRPPQAPKPVQEAPKSSVAHDADGVVGEDSPEAQAAQAEVLIPADDDRPFHADDRVRHALHDALKDSGMTMPTFRRYALETFGVKPDKLGAMTVAQARQSIEWIKGQGKS